jgi:hypothetical protein
METLTEKKEVESARRLRPRDIHHMEPGKEQKEEMAQKIIVNTRRRRRDRMSSPSKAITISLLACLAIWVAGGLGKGSEGDDCGSRQVLGSRAARLQLGDHWFRLTNGGAVCTVRDPVSHPRAKYE